MSTPGRLTSVAASGLGLRPLPASPGERQVVSLKFSRARVRRAPAARKLSIARRSVVPLAGSSNAKFLTAPRPDRIAGGAQAAGCEVDPGTCPTAATTRSDPAFRRPAGSATSSPSEAAAAAWARASWPRTSRVYLAQLGRTVLLIDADPAGAELHTMLGVDLPSASPRRDEPVEDDLTPDPDAGAGPAAAAADVHGRLDGAGASGAQAALGAPPAPARRGLRAARSGRGNGAGDARPVPRR